MLSRDRARALEWCEWQAKKEIPAAGDALALLRDAEVARAAAGVPDGLSLAGHVRATMADLQAPGLDAVDDWGAEVGRRSGWTCVDQASREWPVASAPRWACTSDNLRLYVEPYTADVCSWCGREDRSEAGDRVVGCTGHGHRYSTLLFQLWSRPVSETEPKQLLAVGLPSAVAAMRRAEILFPQWFREARHA